VTPNGVALHYLSQKRGLDILLAHPNADPSRVAVTGLSGGGWQTIFISSLDPRVTLSSSRGIVPNHRGGATPCGVQYSSTNYRSQDRQLSRVAGQTDIFFVHPGPSAAIVAGTNSVVVRRGKGLEYMLDASLRDVIGLSCRARVAHPIPNSRSRMCELIGRR
jgi:hypothetical protein